MWRRLTVTLFVLSQVCLYQLVVPAAQWAWSSHLAAVHRQEAARVAAALQTGRQAATERLQALEALWVARQRDEALDAAAQALRERDEALQKAAQLQQQADQLRQQVAALQASANGLGGGGAAVGGFAGSLANHFAYGYCTWYVASRRYVPWNGNAGQWGPNARAFGFAEGPSPRPGAIMVTWEGPIGHVAYVESVNADGSWVVSEMNFVNWNVVDRRTIRPGTVPLETFIY